MPPRKRICTAALIALSLATVVTDRALAQQGVIDFENVAPKTKVTTQFASQGVRFVPSGFVDSDPAARSGTRVLRAANPTAEFHSGPLTMEFSSDQVSVRMFAADRFSGTTGTLRAFDAGGNLVATDGPKPVSRGAYTTVFEVTAATPSIRRVVLQYSSTAFESIDDLEFTGTPPAPAPTTVPTVTIGLADGSTTSQQAVTLTGTVTGEQLVSPGRLEVAINRPPGSLAPSTLTSAVMLEGAGDSRTFAIPLQLQIGPQTITVSVENAGGLRGQASVRLSFFPGAILDAIRFEGTENLGDFAFSGSDQGCVYVVFQRAAVAQTEGVGVTTVRGGLLKRWLSQQENGFPTLGCSAGLERRIEAEDIRFQDFQKGRIYAEANGAAFFTPTVFAEAIDAYGGETSVGVPMEEPKASSGAMETFLFQRFRRPGRREHDATLEIRGNPPRLFVERRADDPRIPIPSPASPTLVGDHACSTNLGPCEVRFVAADDNPLSNMGRFCNDEHFDWEGLAAALLDNSKIDLIDTNPREWSAIEGDHVLTHLQGVVLSAKPAGGDNPLAHEFPIDCPPDLAPFVANWTKDREPSFCSADLDVIVSPLRGFRRLIGIGVGSNPEHDDDVVIEYERGHARAFTAFGADPHVGDLVIAAGRWIVDCGHAYKTEIHPPSVLSYVRTLANGENRSTLAHVWVNGFYPGDPVEILIHPPPRPSPDAVLSIERNVATEIGLTVDEDIGIGQFLRLRISAPRRLVKVTDIGEMRMEPERDFKARYTLSWTK